MAARKKEEQINLLPQKGFQTSTAGRILAWILTTFRVIVIVTEIIVMIAFLSRFWFDAQNTDLNEKIQQKQAVLTASRDFEHKFKDVQNRLGILSNFTQNQTATADLLNTIKNSLPSDVILTNIRVEKGTLEITGLTPSERSIQQLIVNLGDSKLLSGLGLSEANTSPDNPAILDFTISAKVESGKGG